MGQGDEKEGGGGEMAGSTKNMRGQTGTFPVHALRYVNSTKVMCRLALEGKWVFRDVRINC